LTRPPLELRTLSPGGQTALEVARQLVEYLNAARRSLEIALYDVRLPGEPGDLVADSLRQAHERGVAVRLAYNGDYGNRVPVPPPPRTKPELLEALPIETRGIPGIPDLMHHKYAVRDGESVWSGSTNWTSDSWELQENVIVIAHDADAAASFTRNFEELWQKGSVEASGFEQPSPSSGYRAYIAATYEVWGDDVRLEPTELIDLGDRLVLLADMPMRAQASGVPLTQTYAGVSTLKDGR